MIFGTHHSGVGLCQGGGPISRNVVVCCIPTPVSRTLGDAMTWYERGHEHWCQSKARHSMLARVPQETNRAWSCTDDQRLQVSLLHHPANSTWILGHRKMLCRCFAVRSWLLKSWTFYKSDEARSGSHCAVKVLTWPLVGRKHLISQLCQTGGTHP